MGWRSKIFPRKSNDKLQLSHSKVILVGLAIFLGFFSLSHTEFGRTTETKFARKLQFKLRDYFGKNPALDKRLKIIIFDDWTRDSIQKNFTKNDIVDDLDLDSWATFYEKIAERQPLAIFTDRVYGSPEGSMEQRQKFVERLKKIEAPIIAPVFLQKTEGDIMSAQLVDTSVGDFQISNWSKSTPRFLNKDIDGSHKAFGPHKSVQGAFEHFGHIMVRDSYLGEAQAFVQPRKDVVIPHWSFFLAGHRQITDQSIFLNGLPLNVDSNGRFLINLLPSKDFKSQTTYVWENLKQIIRKKPLTDISPGDVVLILFSYTGMHDWYDTFYGPLEGGYINASIANSVLTGNWLHRIDDHGALIALFVALAMLLGAFVRPTITSFALAALVLAVPTLSIYSFVSFGIELPWMYPLAGFVVTSSILSYDRYRLTEKKSDRIRTALSGMISEDKLDQLIQSPEKLDITPSSREVSIMFVDMVGFSIVAERTAPEEAFTLLKENMQEITRAIHNYGGVIDRTLGDGVLCFFGYHYDGSEIVGSHATQAIDCAIHIQREMLQRNLAAHKIQKPNFPLRIGINSEKVFIGDMGDERRLDYTLIGDGVNFAQRLEAGCESYQILVSDKSMAQYEGIDRDRISITEKYVKIKHHLNLMKTYEINPFVKEGEQLYKAIQAYRSFAGLERAHERVPTTSGNRLEISTQYDDGYLVNFSASGFGIWLPRYIGRGIDLELRVQEKSTHEELRKILQSESLFPLFAQVRWAKPVDNGFMHGLELQNLSEQRQKRIYEILFSPRKAA